MGAPEADLNALLSGMQPELSPDEFVYCTVPAGAERPPSLEPVCVFREAEGDSLIIRRDDAERVGLPFTFSCRRITLRVHSSLEAVGFLAKIAQELAENGISVNCVSAYYHDHLFVPAGEAERALHVLQGLQRRSRRHSS